MGQDGKRRDNQREMPPVRVVHAPGCDGRHPVQERCNRRATPRLVPDMKKMSIF